MKKLTAKQRKRRSEIIRALSEMSRNWSRWHCSDWQPLERELAKLT